MIRYIALIVTLLTTNTVGTALAVSPEALRFFETKVRPLLAESCYVCHGPDKAKGDLRLNDLSHVLKGGQSGPALVIGKPEESLMIKAVRRGDPDFAMPPKEPLSKAQIAILEKWVTMGAPWPAGSDNRGKVDADGFTEDDRNWWAVQPVTDPKVVPGTTGWARNEVDHFVFRGLKKAGLKPAAEADPRELVRRAYFDLHGLPPTPEQVQSFLNDERPDAWQRLVKQLLDSPRYGERWAQHWLDVVRYAESDGYREDAFRPSAGKYRNYVIRSINDDKPYDRFVKEHLAGDEIDPTDPDVFIGTAFLRHGIYEWNQRNARMHWDLIINEMTRVTGEVFLGVGIGCAQCHDHKFDPILQKDYFAMQAFLATVEWPIRAELATPKQKAAYRKQRLEWEQATKAIRDKIHAVGGSSIVNSMKGVVKQFPADVQDIYRKPDAEKTPFEKQLAYLVQRQVHRATNNYAFATKLKSQPEKLKRIKELEAELKKFDKLKPKELPEAFVATDIDRRPTTTFLKTRTGKTAIEPAFLTLLDKSKPQIKPTKISTGRRLALANWIANEDNPLTTRVIVNRLWQRHFGRGIVATPNDFGTLGEPPSHPELLDWLTSRFLEGGWKLKPIHEQIMNSAAYRQTARREPNTDERMKDPGNRLLWRYPVQRLDAEQVRDAMLTISGELKQREGGSSVDGSSPYRSVYVKRLRNKPDELLGGFDKPTGFDSAPDRVATTTPIQSLLLVNGKWSLDRSRALAKRLLGKRSSLGESEIRNAWQIVYGREPHRDEVSGALTFIKQQAGDASGIETAKPKYPNETGLRPIAQHFKDVKGFDLGEKSLWIQPGSRFERLRAKANDLGNEFTFEAVTILDRIYPDAAVNTILSRWGGYSKSPGWNIGITSAKSAYQPRNFILQLIGENHQGTLRYEVVPSNLRFPLGKPVYIAAAVSARTSTEDPTEGRVTFYLKDLSDPKAPLQTKTVKTTIVSKIQNSNFDLITGGRTSSKPSHLWDGQVARLALSRGALPKDKLLIGKNANYAERVLDWKFNGTNGEVPAKDTTWLRAKPQQTSKMLAAVTDLCHALFNSNEFLYLH
ncbi:MAG: PSD1 and planctomycete cytochrome C domain-containing protein [Limisphaerales bacterium]